MCDIAATSAPADEAAASKGECEFGGLLVEAYMSHEVDFLFYNHFAIPTVPILNTIWFVVSRQPSPHFAGAPSHRARDTLPLRSPSLTSTSAFLTHPHRPPFCALHRSPLLTHLALDLLIPGRAAVESVNSWREGFRGARTGSWEFALISILERQSHSIGKLL